MIKTSILPGALNNPRQIYLTALFVIAALVLSACTGERRSERVPFDGQFFRATAKKQDKQRLNFEVAVRPVSASLDGAREAGRYEAIRYCIGNFGTSNINWSDGPDAEDGTLRIANDRLLLLGTCAPQ